MLHYTSKFKVKMCTTKCLPRKRKQNPIKKKKPRKCIYIERRNNKVIKIHKIIPISTNKLYYLFKKKERK